MTTTLITFNSSRWVEAAEDVLELMLKHESIGARLRQKGRTGGFLCVTELSGGLLLLAPIGAFRLDMTEAYRHFCQEKATRLASHQDHVLSRQSADEALERYPGAVRGSNYITSFSGLPGLDDELLSAATQRRNRGLTHKKLDELFGQHPNPAFSSLSEDDRVRIF